MFYSYDCFLLDLRFGKGSSLTLNHFVVTGEGEMLFTGRFCVGMDPTTRRVRLPAVKNGQSLN